ncbi:acetate/propionate family kinase [Jiella avicenniae]|uniref:Acetate kinase n=1 Tax=Jiella avicenniae TaxID=2907202 RepID=A0A9X1T7Q5_9HYPH|nr:acetate/propionate family kinase [Jiella avicenniae]MCE7030700.1 acetate/propionate family kinase [Jiella avicenniae]
MSAPPVLGPGDAVLCLNAGSSSLKLALFAAAEGGSLVPLARGRMKPAEKGLHLAMNGEGLAPLDETVAAGSGDDDRAGDPAHARLLDWAAASTPSGRLAGIGHRVVHGGSHFAGPAVLDGAAIAAVEALTPLAPLHQPLALGPIQAVARLRPELAQTASFDTVFHRSIAPVLRRYALPRDLADREGLTKFGFHGVSYDFVAGELARRDPDGGGKRTVVAHLGSGASLCAIRHGASVDTTMGFSVLDGLVMATRCGSLDPGVVLHLFKRTGMTPEAVEDLLYHRSGLLGVSGLSRDMRELLAGESAAACEAVELFVVAIARETAAMAAALGGIDRFVFTGGIGENQPEVRARVAERLAWLGLAVEERANRSGAARISPDGAPVEVLTLATDEESVIARDAARLLA